MKSKSVTIQMKATGVGGGGVLFYGIVYYAVQRVSSISFALVFGLSSFLF